MLLLISYVFSRTFLLLPYLLLTTFIRLLVSFLTVTLYFYFYFPSFSPMLLIISCVFSQTFLLLPCLLLTSFIRPLVSFLTVASFLPSMTISLFLARGVSICPLAKLSFPSSSNSSGFISVFSLFYHLFLLFVALSSRHNFDPFSSN